MKKHLIAAAVAAAVAVPAMAQNVTLSGYVEAGYQDLSLKGDAATRTAEELKAFTAGPFGSSRLVISGSEDLGGGLKAGFRLESSLDVANGRMGSGTLGAQAGTTTTGTSAEFFNRGAELNLSGAFGMVRVGQFDHRGGEDTDLNVVGNIALASGNSNGNLSATGVELGTDRKGTIAYRTPTMGGITFEVAHSTEDGQKPAATTDSSLGAVQSYYAEGKIGNIGFRAGHATQAAVGAITTTNNDAKRTGAGVSYDFGVASASLHYATATLIDQTKNKETVVSVKVPLSGSLDVRGAWRNFNSSNDAATTLLTADRKEYTIALANALSKRTTAYAAFTNFDRTSTNAVGNTDSKRVFLGVGHSF
jgi:predicted porin